jgi:hypothetical protein
LHVLNFQGHPLLEGVDLGVFVFEIEFKQVDLENRQRKGELSLYCNYLLLLLRQVLEMLLLCMFKLNNPSKALVQFFVFTGPPLTLRESAIHGLADILLCPENVLI